MKKKIRNVIIMLIIGVMVVVGVEIYGGSNKNEKEVKSNVLNVLYTDKKLEPYISAVTKAFEKTSDSQVKAQYISQTECFARVNQSNVEDAKDKTDLFIIDSQFLEEAVKAGLAEEIGSSIHQNKYYKTGINATVYHDKTVAYPLCYDVSFLIYNSNYINKVPNSFDEILEFANEFSNDNVNNIMKWDVKKLFYNYGFVGKYLDVGGTFGDEKTVDIVNEKSKNALTYYRNLSQYFSIDFNKVNQEEIISEFVDGKTIFTIGDMEYLSLIEDRIPYDITPLPNLDNDLETASLAYTKTAVINPYSENVEASKLLAEYMTITKAAEMIELTGYMPCAIQKEYKDPRYEKVAQSYEKAKNLPKLMSASDYWVYLEICLNNIWEGKNIKKELNNINNILQKVK